MKDGYVLVDLDFVFELEFFKEKFVVKKKMVKFSIEIVFEKEEKVVYVSFSSVIKIKDCKRVCFFVKKKKEMLSIVDVLGSGDEVEVKVVNFIVSVVEVIFISFIEEKINENVELFFFEVMEKVLVNEIRDCEINGYN